LPFFVPGLTPGQRLFASDTSNLAEGRGVSTPFCIFLPIVCKLLVTRRIANRPNQCRKPQHDGPGAIVQCGVNLMHVALRNSKKAQPGNYKDHPGSEQNCLGDDQPRRFPAGLFWRDRRRELALNPRHRGDVLAAITASYGLPRLNLLGFEFKRPAAMDTLTPCEHVGLLPDAVSVRQGLISRRSRRIPTNAERTNHNNSRCRFVRQWSRSVLS